MPYLLDSNTLIEAKDNYYGFDFCPCYWDWLIRQNGAGQIFSVRHVLTEIQDVDDELRQWAVGLGPGFFLPLDAATNESLTRVSNYVHALPPPVSAANKRSFLSRADPILIAHALAHGHTIATREVLVPDNSTKVKIPNICRYFGVPTVRPFDMLRQLNATFVLAPDEGD